MPVAQLFLNLRNHRSADFSEDEWELGAIASLFPLNFDESGMQIKEILESTYTDGITGLESVENDGKKITGIFLDQVSPTITKRYRFTIAPDNISYQLENPNDLGSSDFAELEYAATKMFGGSQKPKNCTDGTSCGNGCINKNKVCRKPPTQKQKEPIAKLINKGKKTSANKTASSEDNSSSNRMNSGTHKDIPGKKFLSLNYEKIGEDKNNWRFYVEIENTDTGGAKQKNVTKSEWLSLVKEHFGGDQKEAKSGKLFNKQEQIDKMAALANISIKEAEAAYQDINDFADDSYTEIRNFQRGINTDLSPSKRKELSKKIKNINKYIENAPTYKGDIYRGMNFATSSERDDFLSKISEGVELDAISSFSSSKSVAKEYAAGSAGTEDSPRGKFGVLFKTANKSGVSIRSISNFQEEEEVLVPKGAKYSIKSIKKSGKTIVVELDER